MTASFWHRLDGWARRLLPLGMTLVLLMAEVMPLPVRGYAAIVPMLVIASVFFWAIHRPQLLPPSVVFAVGLIHDVLTGAVLGSGVIVLLLVYGAAAAQRRFFLNKSFILVWWGFMMVAAGAALLEWLIASALHADLLPMGAAVFQYIFTLALYPLVTWILHGAERVLPAEA